MRVLNAKVIGLLAAALVAMALLLVAPLSSLASARVEARAGDAVAIAGDDDCDVDTNDEDAGDDGDDTDDGNNGDDDGDDTEEGDDDGDSEEDDISETEDEDNATSTQYEDEDNGDEDNNQDEDEDNGGSGDGNGGAVARVGDVVAIAGGCDSGTEVIEENVEEVIEENVEENIEIGGDDDTEDVDSEDDDEISDSTGLQDGNTENTSNLNTLRIEGEYSDNVSFTEETTNRSSETAARENGFGFGGTFGSGNNSESRRVRDAATSLSGWPFPGRDEMRRLGEAKRFEADPGAAMTLSIRTLKLYDVPVTDSNTRKGLGRGVVHAPDTAYPWDEGDQKNVFLTGHRLGSPAKDSRMVFYQLDELKRGDEIVLKDNSGRSYKYRVRELFKVDANDTWIADTLVGRDVLTLQTYTLPDFQDRLVVRADRVQPRPDRGGNSR